MGGFGFKWLCRKRVDSGVERDIIDSHFSGFFEPFCFIFIFALWKRTCEAN